MLCNQKKDGSITKKINYFLIRLYIFAGQIRGCSTHFHYFHHMQTKSPKVTIFDVEVDALNMDETVHLIDNYIHSGRQVVHNCINANKVVLMDKDIELRKSLNEADIISADGQAVVWASEFLKKPLPERVPGIDLMENLMALANKKGYKVFLFGARENVVKNVADHYNMIFNPNLVVGYRNGYFLKADELEIVEQINSSGANMLFVAIPSPKKEFFINTYRSQVNKILLLMGVGGSFDVISGKVKRAPRWMQDNGLEWLFRLIQEPKKMWKRYLIGNVKYIYLTIKEILSKK